MVQRVLFKTYIGSDRLQLEEQALDRTEQLNESMKREALTMRVITVITLVYLPATFVSVSFALYSYETILYDKPYES